MSTVQEVINKLQKLKQQAIAAPDFPSLEKVDSKVEKIRAKLSDHRSHKQLVLILDNIQKLVAEKKKYFRQIIIKNSQQIISDENLRNEEADRTLKYSKSADNFKTIAAKTPTQAPPKSGFLGSKGVIEAETYKDGPKTKAEVRRKNNNEEIEFEEASNELQYSRGLNISKKNINSTTVGSAKSIQRHLEQNEEDIDKTTVNQRKNRIQAQQKQQSISKGQINFLQQKLSYSFKQIDDLNKKIALLEDFKEKNSRQVVQPTSPSAKNFLAKQQSIVDEYGRKLREKNFMIQDLKSKMEYFKSMNDQLKNKIINEQRRNEDYVQSIKQETKTLRKQVQRLKKQNDVIKVDLEDLEDKNQGLINQVKKLVEKLEEEVKDKQNMRKNLTSASSAKVQQLQKQITNLTTQCANLGKLEVRLQHQQEQKNQLAEFRKKLESRMIEIESQYRKMEEQRNRLELQLYKLEQDKKNLHIQLKVSNQAKQILADELLDARQQLEQQAKLMNMNEYQNELRMKNKVSKLKEVKGLLNELR